LIDTKRLQGKSIMKRKKTSRIIEDSVDSMSILDTEELEQHEGASDEMKIDFECASAELVVIDEY
jgi:hypothetical protein